MYVDVEHERIEPAKPAREHVTPYTHNVNSEIQTWRTLTIYSSYQIWSETHIAHKFDRRRAQAFALRPFHSLIVFRWLQQACWSGFMYVVSLVSRLPMQIVEETVTYGWPQGTSPYLVVTIYSKRPPCLNFAVYTGYMLPRRLRRLDALLV